LDPVNRKKLSSKAIEITDDIPALLCTVNDNTEVAGIESLLRSCDIPVMIKWRHAGDTMIICMAVSSFGADIYVPSKQLERAKDLLAADSTTEKLRYVNKKSDDDAEFAQVKTKQEKTRRERALIIIALLFGLPVLIALVTFVTNLFG